jgi:transcriptional regulator NrdR family protein
MKCPQCTGWLKVLQTKQQPDGTTYRRYECANLHRFSTLEQVAQLKRGRQRKNA